MNNEKSQHCISNHARKTNWRARPSGMYISLNRLPQVSLRRGRVTLNCKEVVAKGACTLCTITRSITECVFNNVQSYQITIKNVPIIYKTIELDFLTIGRNTILSLQRRCQPLIRSYLFQECYQLRS